MQITLVLALVLHVLSGVFWAGSTFTLARIVTSARIVSAQESLFRPQMGAAVVAVATGGLLWFLLHRGAETTTERVLAAGALCALLAAGIQGITGGGTLRLLATAGEADISRLHARMITGQRVAAGLLAVTVVCMTAARYV